jgi:hypothetical protein
VTTARANQPRPGGRPPDLTSDVAPGEALPRQGDGYQEVTATSPDPGPAPTATPAPYAAADTTGTAPTDGDGQLLAAGDAAAFRARWTDVQHGFVDAPRQAVEHADRLVAELMQHLARTFADERGRLEDQWDRGGDASTEDLRAAFQRYRSFFDRSTPTALP